MKCPKCESENTDTARFCSNCATSLTGAEEAQPLPTQTIETPREELTTGSTFAGRYQIIEELGKGGMGKVYKVHDTKIKEKVALKLIKPEIASDRNTLERFSNELRIARKITHKNVGKMFDINDEAGTHYITMEYVSGQDLKGLIRQTGQLTVGKAVSIAKQICDGLSEAHSLGVVHRDLKPQNIMVDRQGNAHIMDFGIARSVTGKGITGAGVMIGTPEYMSPEQVEAKEVDQRGDIYSLGVILYEMVTGKVPFEGDTPFAVGVKHKSEIPEDPGKFNAQVMQDLSRVILKCLEKEKAARFQDAVVLHAALQEVESGLPITESVAPRQRSTRSREVTVTFNPRKFLIPALAVLALAAAALIIWRPWSGKAAAPSPGERRSIAVISFENQTGDPAFDHLKKVIPNLLITSLEQSGYFSVVTWERLYDFLKQLGKDDVEFIDSELGFELCQAHGINTIVLGTFAKAGDMFATDAKVLDVSTKAMIWSSSSRGKGEGSILESQIDELSREISKGAGMSPEQIEPSSPELTEVLSSSMEAYNYYLKGREAARKFNRREAAEHYEKAVELDPTFAQAWSSLGWQYIQLGNTKGRNDAYAKAKDYSYKFTEKARLYFDARYALVVEGDREKQFRILTLLAEKYPEEKWPFYQLGFYHSWSGEDEKAVEEYEKALELDPDMGSALNELGFVYLRLGEYEKAVSSLKKYVSVTPGEPNAVDSLAQTYFERGDLDMAIAKYREALELDPDFLTSIEMLHYIHAVKEDYAEAHKWIDRHISLRQYPGLKARDFALKGFYHNWLCDQKTCDSLLQRAEDLAGEANDDSARAYVHFVRAWIHFERGEHALSRKFIDSWIDLSKEFMGTDDRYFQALYVLLQGFIDLDEGSVEEAKIRLEEAKRIYTELNLRQQQRLTPYEPFLAEMMLSKGSPDEVIELLDKPAPHMMPYPNYLNLVTYNLPFLKDALPRAYMQKGDLDRAVSAYERLIATGTETRRKQLIDPRIHYQLAKLYEQKSWAGKAIEHYEKFLTLWKDADPALPEVSDARERLARLQNR
jgi:serine/threonine protein kinase/tetratricopeptide (TPR) repeat protein